jgi:hypothetical protein
MVSLGTTDTGIVTLGAGDGRKVNEEFTAHGGSASVAFRATPAAPRTSDDTPP